MKIKTVIDHRTLLPERYYDYDAGADLRVARSYKVSNTIVKMRTGVAVAIPKGYAGIVALRSSVGASGLTMPNGIGVIDSGYTGEISIPIVAIDGKEHKIYSGERVAQLLVIPIATPEFVPVKELDETLRGEKGFGSTGTC